MSDGTEGQVGPSGEPDDVEPAGPSAKPLGRRNGLICPKCGGQLVRVQRTRAWTSTRIIRWRRCESCGADSKTKEEVIVDGENEMRTQGADCRH